MSFQSDAEAAASVSVGGTDRSSLFYDSTSHLWRTKNQIGTLANLVTGVDSITNSDSTLTISPTTGAVIASLAAAYKSKIDNWFNKAVFNVLDNGISTSNTGAQNVTAWNALMVTMANSSGTVYFPSAALPYDFASVLNIPAGVHIRVQGGGPTSRTSDAFGTIIRTTSATADMFTCSEWYQEFNSLTFRSSVTRTGGAVINSGNNVGIQVINCNFNSQFNGVVFTGGSSAGNLGLIDNCHFTDTVNFSMQIDGANCNAIIRATTADGLPAAVAHLEVNQCGSLILSDCDLIHGVSNMRLNPDSGTKGVFSVYCSNVFFDTSSGSSVKFQGGAAGTNIQRVKFVNCWFSGSVTGCEFAAATSTNKATSIDFVNCDIFSNSANGILATEVQDFSLSNCRIAGNSTSGINTLATAGSVTKFNIQNCTIGPTGGIGANGIGINVQAGTYGAYNITGNNVAGNTSNNNIIDAGSVATTDMKKVGDNLGHLLKGALVSQGGTPLSVPITTETLVLSARVPANAVIIGQVFRIRVIGVMSAANAITWRCRVGAAGTVAGDAVAWVAVASAVGAANTRHGCEIYVTVRSATTIQAEGIQYSESAAGVLAWQSAVVAVAATTAITSTAAWFIDVSLSQTIGTTLIQQAVIEAL